MIKRYVIIYEITIKNFHEELHLGLKCVERDKRQGLYNCIARFPAIISVAQSEMLVTTALWRLSWQQ